MNPEAESSFSLELQEKHVARAWMAASISAGLNLIFGVLAAAGLMQVLGLDGWIILDAAFLAALGYGVWKRSRVCAVLLVVYGIGNEFYATVDQTSHFSLLRIVFVYFYLRGAIQVFRDHRRRAALQRVSI